MEEWTTQAYNNQLENTEEGNHGRDTNSNNYNNV